MNKYVSLIFLLSCFAQPVFAANINLGSSEFSQAEFKAFSEDLGSALSYKAVTPTAPLGISGFDVGLEATSTEMKNPDLWVQATGSSRNSLVLPKLHVYKGLPLNIDIGAFYSAVPTTNIKYYGGEIRYAILAGGVTSPALGIRGSLTKLSGVDQLSFNTKGLDVSISKGFTIFTPYVGIGSVWVESTPQAGSLGKETFLQNKIFVGGNVNLGLANFALEYDKTGHAQSYSAKLGFRF